MEAHSFAVSRRLYPPPLEWGRLARLTAAALARYVASLFVQGPRLVAIPVKLALLALIPLLWLASGFFTPAERRWLAARLRRGEDAGSPGSEPSGS